MERPFFRSGFFFFFLGVGGVVIFSGARIEVESTEDAACRRKDVAGVVAMARLGMMRVFRLWRRCQCWRYGRRGSSLLPLGVSVKCGIQLRETERPVYLRAVEGETVLAEDYPLALTRPALVFEGNCDILPL